MKKLVISIGIIVITVFSGVIIFHELNCKDINLTSDDSLDLYCDIPKLEKGVIVINDSIAIEGNTQQIVELSSYTLTERTTPLYRPKNAKYIPTLYDLNGPYRIIKKAHNDTIKIIKNEDTLYFHFLGLKQKNLDDPTISEILKNMFNEKTKKSKFEKSRRN